MAAEFASERRVEIVRRAVGYALPGWVGILLATAWPLVKRYVIPAVIQLLLMLIDDEKTTEGAEPILAGIGESARRGGRDYAVALARARGEVDRLGGLDR